MNCRVGNALLPTIILRYKWWAEKRCPPYRAEQLINAYIDAEHTKAANEQRRQAAEAKKAQNTGKHKAVEPVTPKPKRTVTINPAEIMTLSGNAFIETEQQVDDYLNQLREQLLAVVKSGDKVRLK